MSEIYKRRDEFFKQHEENEIVSDKQKIKSAKYDDTDIVQMIQIKKRLRRLFNHSTSFKNAKTTTYF